jgi:type VI secretion system VasI family protein
MKRLAKVVMMAALVGLVGCNEDAPQAPVMTAQEKQALAEKNAKWLAEQQAKQATYEAQLAKEKAEENIGKQWAVFEDKDDMHDTKNVQLYVRADRFNGHLDDFPALKAKEKNKPVLVIECEANTTKMFVAWHNMIADAGDTTYINYRIGEHKAVATEWQRATNYKALGLWNGKKAIPVIKKMLNEKQFIIQVTPEAGEIEKAVFNIEGLEKHIDKVKNACHWK